jgi:hypothetical protein
MEFGADSRPRRFPLVDLRSQMLSDLCVKRSVGSRDLGLFVKVTADQLTL